MNRVLKYAGITILTLTGSFNAGFSQDLIPASKKVVAAYDFLGRNPSSREAELKYIRAFPAGKALFMTVFQPENFGQLYSDSHKYITAFFDLDKHYHNLIVDKSIDIGKDLVWEADAMGDIQNGIMILSVTYPDSFIKKLKNLSAAQQHNLITFLADVENHPAYPHYQQLIDILYQKKETALATAFIDARTAREKEKE